MKRLLLTLVLVLPALARGQEDLSWLSKPAPVCAQGAVSKACKCGGVKTTSGYCCSGVAHAWPCLPIDETAATDSDVYWDGSAIHDTKDANRWTMAGTVPQVAASGSIPAGAGPYSTSNYYTAGNVLNRTGSFSACIIFSTTSTGQQIFFAKDAAGQRQFEFGINGASGAVYAVVYRTGGVGQPCTAGTVGTVPTTGVNIACLSYGYVADATSRMRVSLNAITDGTITNANGPPIAVTSDLRIGERQYATAESPLAGKVYQVMTWNVELSGPEIAAIKSTALSRMGL